MLPIANIYNLNQISEEDKFEAGAISTDLVRLADYGLAIPNSFIFTANASKKYLEELKLPELLDRFINTTRIDSVMDFKKFSAQAEKKILEGDFSIDLRKQIERFYSSLSGFSDAFTQIKMAEKSINRIEKASGFDYVSFSNVKGVKEIMKSIKCVLASIFTPEYLYYLMSKNISPLALNYPVLIQKMVQPEISGNLFTLNSYNDNNEEILIEAVLGLYEPIQLNDLTPDHYIVEKSSEKILQKYIVPQEWMLIRKGNSTNFTDSNFKVNISKAWQHKQKLEDKYILQLLKISKIIEKAFNKVAMQIVWFYESGRIWIYSVNELPKLEIKTDDKGIVHVSEKTTLGEIKRKLGVEGNIKIFKNSDTTKLAEVYTSESKEVKEEKGTKIEKLSFESDKYELLLTGSSGVNGKVIGKIKIISEEEELSDINKDDIVVLESIASKYVSFLKNAGALILDENGTINDVVLLAKDYKIPCVVGAAIASKILKQGEMIGVDGDTGKIYEVSKSSKGIGNIEKNIEKRIEVKKEELKLKTDVIVLEPRSEIQKEIKLKEEKPIETLKEKSLLDSEFEKTFIEDLTVKEIQKVKEVAKVEEKKEIKLAESSKQNNLKYPNITTACKLMLSIQDSSSVTVEDVLYTDGVGILRSELILTKYGDSINDVLNNKELKTQLDKDIYEALMKVSEAYNPKPVIYRFVDFKSNGIAKSKDDRNPLIGQRGAYSLLNNEGIIETELEAIRKVRNVKGLKNLWVNIPFARSVSELAEVKKKILEYGFKRSNSFKIYVSIETPAMAYSIDKILELDVDGIIIDTNDLVQLLLGADNSFNGFKCYDLKESGIYELITMVSEKCSRRNVPVIVTGNLISDDTSQNMIKTIVESGISALSINKDKFGELKEMVSRIESKLLLSKREPHKKAKLTFPKRKK